MDTDLLLGLDIGTTHSKALLVDATGAEVALAAKRTPFVAAGDRIEMPVAALLGAVTALVAGLGTDLGRVAAVGIAGMAECGAPLDPSGSALAPVIAWHDARGAEVAALLEASFGDHLARRTGQRPRAVSSIAKLGWLLANGCPTPARWLGVPELVLRDLTGSEATEHSFVSRTGFWDVVEQVWLEEVAQAAGFSASVVAPIRAAGTSMGTVRHEAARRWGLRSGIPVTLGGHDHLAGSIGVGAARGDVVNSVGTAETVVTMVAAAPDLGRALERRAAVSVAPGGRGWAILTGAARAGVVLDAAQRLLGLPAAELDHLAENTPPIDATALALDLQAGVPVHLPDAPAGAIWGGLLVALARRTADAVERLADLAPAETLLVIGGGSSSRPWIRAKAELVGLPIVRPRTAQAAARGAAVFAGQAAGWWPSPEAAPKPQREPV